MQKAIAGEELVVRARPRVESRQGVPAGRRRRLSTAIPGYFRTDYQKTLAVTAADVKRVANKYLTNGRVVLSIVPMGQLDQAAKPAESTQGHR